MTPPKNSPQAQSDQRPQRASSAAAPTAASCSRWRHRQATCPLITSTGWPDRELVQQTAAQVPWFHNCLLLDRVSDPATRQWYIQAARREGCSRNILSLQIQGKAHLRHGKAQNNFPATLPPAWHVHNRRERFADPSRRQTHPGPAAGAREEPRVTGIRPSRQHPPHQRGRVENQPTRALPQELEGSLPTIEQIEAELSGDMGDVDE